MLKKVVFICLLSLSTCLSDPDGLQAATPSTNGTTTAISKDPQPPSTTKEAVVVPQHPETAATVPPSTQATNATTAAATNSTVPATPKTDADANKTTDKKEPAKKDETVPETKPAAKNETITPPSPDKKENATIPADNGKKNETTTVKPIVTPKPTEAPKATTDVPLQAARGFDGPSFIGGIILTIGLLAIGFMGFKYYKNQTERNYHTL